MRRSVPLLLALAALSGCAVGDRGLVTPHQPVVAANAAAVPNCPDWSDKDAPGERETQSSNFGCATMGNLALMIADPQDLLRGRSADTSSADTATRAIKANRDMQPSLKSWQVTTTVAPGGSK